MNLQNILSLEDFTIRARRVLPRPIFGYIEQGVETSASLCANRAAFDSFTFVTRVLRDVSKRSLEIDFLGKRYAAPFGIAPMGIAALFSYRGDIVFAEAARQANIPMIMSGASLIRMEDIVAKNPDAWFQAYLFGDMESTELMLRRVEAAGFKTLVVTVDAQGNANRENFVRVGFSTPLRPSLRLLFDGIVRPHWLIRVLMRTYFRYGMPHFENGSHVRGAPILSSKAARQFEGRSRFSWEHVKYIRERWQGNLIIKGILSVEDAALAQRYGADAIVLSNHGGRQLDGAIPPLHILSEVTTAVPGLPVIVDGGFRRGSDVVKALALGAKLVLIGRPFAYAAAVADQAGVLKAVDLLIQEISRNMAMLGFTSIDQIDATCIRRAAR